ncbi:MAG: rhomboid family intramembrane serine protease [Bacteroidota bacterium]
MGGRITDTVKTLLIANVLFFLGTGFVGDYAYKIFALWFPENPNFGVWQIASHMFMHGDFSHILFNMFALYIFGSVLEQTIGQNKFIFLYISAGIGAAALQILFSYWGYMSAVETYLEAGYTNEDISQTIQFTQDVGNKLRLSEGVPKEVTDSLVSNYVTPMVGASGAIFGVLAAFAIVYPNMPLYIIFVPIPIKAKYLIGGYFLINVYSAVTGSTILGPSNTAYWAHIGGAVVGFLIMWYWKKNSFNQNRWN